MFTPIKVNADGPAIEDDRITAFIVTKDGEDTEYTIPKRISGPTALEALTHFVQYGEKATVLWLSEHALGKDGMAAVMASPQLELGDVQKLVTQIGELYLGQVKELGKE